MKESAGSTKKVLIILQNSVIPKDPRVWQEACALRDLGFLVSIICPVDQAANQTPGKEILHGVHIFRHPLPFRGRSVFGYLGEYGISLFYEFFFSIYVYIKNGFDVIHASNPPDNIFLVALPFKLLGVKFVFDHHDISPELFEMKFGKKRYIYKLLLAFEKFTFKTCDIVISTNESYKKIAHERGGVDLSKIHIVRNGPDPGRIKAMAPNHALKNGRDFLVGYVGLMSKQEGIDGLLRVVSYIVNGLERTDIHFCLIGSGDEIPCLKNYAKEINVAEFVTFTGYIPDSEMIEILNTADVCVNPDAVNEMNDKSTMIKIMEYMALGKPIVQFETTEGRYSAQGAALYAKKNDEEDFAKKIVKLIDNPELCRTMGEVGSRRVEEQLSWVHQKKRLITAYDSL
ncbi:glycosyltransferase family 4 protein [Deltaproteobacteria bacterium IMCC39524]|nr:glycosyltransferase family 4 protein [Deltaproteobacteria bacterium IMCC39524]